MSMSSHCKILNEFQEFCSRVHFSRAFVGSTESSRHIGTERLPYLILHALPTCNVGMRGLWI